jgi:very-short-patch-repair endonuclease
MLAVLDLNPDGAAVSHHSSAARWGLAGYSLLPYHVMGDRIRGRNHDHIGIVHQPRLWLPDHILRVDNIPTVSPTLTLFHLAQVLRWPQQVERTLDNALAAGLTTVPRLERTLQRLARRGRRGISLMRRLIEARAGSYVAPATNLESRFQQLARQAGFWGFTRQVDIGDEYDWIGRVDFVDRQRKLIVEVQSLRYHSSLSDRARDVVRIAALRAAGWTVLEVHEHDLWYNPEKVISELRQVYR